MRWRSWVIITPPKRDDPIYAHEDERDLRFFCRKAASFNAIFQQSVVLEGLFLVPPLRLNAPINCEPALTSTRQWAILGAKLKGVLERTSKGGQIAL
jgi:hypothetical protein